MLCTQENRFSKCDVCAAIKQAMERTLNSEVRKWLTEVMDKHMQLQWRELSTVLTNERFK